MRYWEIHEARMGKRDFSAARGSEVLVGFEFEIACERENDLEVEERRMEFLDSHVSPSYDEDDWITDRYGNIDNFVKAYSLTLNKITTTSSAHKESPPGQQSYNHTDGIIPHTGLHRYSDVDHAFVIPRQVRLDFEDWKEDREEEAFREWMKVKGIELGLSLDAVRNILSARTNFDISLINHHYTKWFVTEDKSIGPAGAELVSPPMPIKEAMMALRTVFSAIDGELTTNSSTGLHVNISVPDPDKIDLLKLILFMGEGHLLRVFDRENNPFSRSILSHARKLVSGIRNHSDINGVISALNALLREKTFHNMSIDVGKLTKGYLEFRPVGGKGYEEKFQEVEDSIFRFVRIIKLASDPQAERQSYLKKLVAEIQYGEADTTWQSIGVKNYHHFLSILEKDSNVIPERRVIDPKDINSVIGFLKQSEFIGRPNQTTASILGRIFGLFDGDERSRLANTVKTLDLPWMEKLLK